MCEAGPNGWAAEGGESKRASASGGALSCSPAGRAASRPAVGGAGLTAVARDGASGNAGLVRGSPRPGEKAVGRMGLPGCLGRRARRQGGGGAGYPSWGDPASGVGGGRATESAWARLERRGEAAL